MYQNVINACSEDLLCITGMIFFDQLQHYICACAKIVHAGSVHVQCVQIG